MNEVSGRVSPEWGSPAIRPARIERLLLLYSSEGRGSEGVDMSIQRNGLDEMDMKIRGRGLAFCSFLAFAYNRSHSKKVLSVFHFRDTFLPVLPVIPLVILLASARPL